MFRVVPGCASLCPIGASEGLEPAAHTASKPQRPNPSDVEGIVTVKYEGWGSLCLACVGGLDARDRYVRVKNERFLVYLPHLQNAFRQQLYRLFKERRLCHPRPANGSCPRRLLPPGRMNTAARSNSRSGGRAPFALSPRQPRRQPSPPSRACLPTALRPLQPLVQTVRRGSSSCRGNGRGPRTPHTVFLPVPGAQTQAP